jgi:hypothetical protein
MRTCLGCPNPASPRGQWCSQACNARLRKKRYARTCEACGAEFEPASRERDTAKYCSRKCRYEHKRANAVNYPKQGKRSLHRIVMERKLGRPLQRTEIVHHANHDMLDFSEENLELKPSQSVHMKEHWADGSLSMTHERAVALGRRSGEVRRARRAAGS